MQLVTHHILTEAKRAFPSANLLNYAFVRYDVDSMSFNTDIVQNGGRKSSKWYEYQLGVIYRRPQVNAPHTGPIK